MTKWITELLVSIFSPKFAKNWARHLVGAISGWLVITAGLDPQVVEAWAGQTEIVVAGVIMFVLTLLASIGNTKKLEEKL